MLRMKWERLNRGWSQEHISRVARIASSDVSKIERGVLRPYPRQVQRLEKMFGLRSEELLQEVHLVDAAAHAIS